MVSAMSGALFGDDYATPRDCFCKQDGGYLPPFEYFQHGGEAISALELLVAGVCGVMGMAHAINERGKSKTEEA